VGKPGNFALGIADQFRGDCIAHQYGGVILPFTILCRLVTNNPPDCTGWFETIETGGRG
jgi:hypothetical protein